eukprot:PhM_4_TR11622/c1_g1_i10/m.29067
MTTQFPISWHVCFILCFFAHVSMSSSWQDATSTYVTFRIRQQCRIALNEVIPTRAQPSPDLHHITPHDAAILESRKANGSFQHLAMAPAADHSTEHPKMHERKIVLTYRDANDVLTGHVFVDPTRYVSKRAMSGEGVHIGHRHHPGGSHDHPHPAETADASVHDIDEAPHIVYLPPHVRQVMLHCHNASTVTTFRTDRVLHKHRFHASANSGVETDTIQSVGPPDTQFNIVFLSGGYTSAERDMFIANAKTVWHYLSSPTKEAGFDFADTYFSETVPFVRYAPFSNVFWVYQPSAQSGASVKNDNVEVNNNLGCFYPEGANDRGLRCVPDLAIALADVSAARARDNYARTAIIVLVNHKKYGGTGIFAPTYRLGTFSNYFLKYSAGYDPITDTEARSEKTQMMSLVSHEMGHAVGGLMDEYDIGINEDDPRRNRYQNCWMYNDATKPWLPWLDAKYQSDVASSVSMFPGSFQSTYQVLSKPIKPCGYSNFWRPVEHCMMSKLNEYFMCPVCREAVTLKMLEAPINFAAPQCPLPDQLAMVVKGGSLRLTLNSGITADHDFSVDWAAPSALAVYPCESFSDLTCRTVNATALASTNTLYRVDVVITHNSKWVLSDKKDMTKSPWRVATNFTIMFYENATGVPSAPPTGYNATVTNDYCGGAKAKAHSIASKNATQFMSRCRSSPTAICNVTLVIAAGVYVEPVIVEPVVEKPADYMYYAIVGVMVLCIGLWIFAFLKYRAASQHRARPIYAVEFSGPIRIVKFIMIATSVILMLGAIGCVFLGLISYSSMGPFGRVVLFVGLIIAFLLYVLAFVGFWSVQNRSRDALCCNGFLLLISLGLVAYATYLLSGAAGGLTDENSQWSKDLELLWEYIVEKETNFACETQIYLKCTGFRYSCDMLQASSKHCPEGCSVNDKAYSPCRKVLQDYILEYIDIIRYVVYAVLVANVFAVIFNATMFFEVQRQKARIRGIHESRLDRARDQKVNPVALRTHKTLSLLKSMSESEQAAMMQEFNRFDEDGNGQLDRKEFSKFIRQALGFNPSKEEIDTIFRIADTSGDGYLSLHELACLFGSTVAVNMADRLSAPLVRGDSGQNNSAEIQLRARRELRGTGLMSGGDVEMSPYVEREAML